MGSQGFGWRVCVAGMKSKYAWNAQFSSVGRRQKDNAELQRNDARGEGCREVWAGGIADARGMCR